MHYHVYPHISIHGKAQRKPQSGRPLLSTYLQQAGADLFALRACPAPIVAAADRRHYCALRDGLARLSLQRTSDERAAKCVGVLTVVLYVLATEYCEYSHL
jgi:hypothetical protein